MLYCCKYTENSENLNLKYVFICPTFRITFLCRLNPQNYCYKGCSFTACLNQSTAMLLQGWSHCCSQVHVSALSVHQH